MPQLLILWCLCLSWSIGLQAQDQDTLPYCQWSFEAEAGHSTSVNQPVYSREEVAQATGYQPAFSAYWALRAGATWNHTHRLSMGVEVVHQHYDYHEPLPQNTGTWGFRTSARRQLCYGITATYSYNVLQKPRFWWGPSAQFGLAVIDAQEARNDSLQAALASQLPLERLQAMGIYGLGMEGGFALIRQRLWIEGSLRFMHAFSPRVVVQRMRYLDQQQQPQQVVINNGLFNLNIGLRLRFVLGK